MHRLRRGSSLGCTSGGERRGFERGETRGEQVHILCDHSEIVGALDGGFVLVEGAVYLDL